MELLSLFHSIEEDPISNDDFRGELLSSDFFSHVSGTLKHMKKRLFMLYKWGLPYEIGLIVLDYVFIAAMETNRAICNEKGECFIDNGAPCVPGTMKSDIILGLFIIREAKSQVYPLLRFSHPEKIPVRTNIDEDRMTRVVVSFGVRKQEKNLKRKGLEYTIFRTKRNENV
jgi:hypothetical protein